MTLENNITEELTKLAKLHADGALSDEEFKALKARLLSQEFNPAQRAPPPQTARVQEATNKPISDWASWCLALVPIISFPISAILIGATGNLILPYIVPIILWLLFLFIDRDILKKAGVDPGDAGQDIAGIVILAAVFVPAYLYKREKRLGKPLTSFYVCVAVMIVWLLMMLTSFLQTQ